MDFEGARSAVGNDQLYDVTIRVSDGRGGQQDVALVVNVTDVNEGPGRDGTVNGTAGNDNMPVGYIDAQGDQIDGFDGINDRIESGAGNDTIDAGAGDDTVNGGDGVDDIFGGAGNDVLAMGPQDSIYAGDGADGWPVGWGEGP